MTSSRPESLFSAKRQYSRISAGLLCIIFTGSSNGLSISEVRLSSPNKTLSIASILSRKANLRCKDAYHIRSQLKPFIILAPVPPMVKPWPIKISIVARNGIRSVFKPSKSRIYTSKSFPTWRTFHTVRRSAFLRQARWSVRMICSRGDSIIRPACAARQTRAHSSGCKESNSWNSNATDRNGTKWRKWWPTGGSENMEMTSSPLTQRTSNWSKIRSCRREPSLNSSIWWWPAKDLTILSWARLSRTQSIQITLLTLRSRKSTNYQQDKDWFMPESTKRRRLLHSSKLCRITLKASNWNRRSHPRRFKSKT